MSEKTKQLVSNRYVGKKELWMFSLGGLGQGMIYAMMSSYISDYYLNVLHLTPVFVLLLMLLARVWDAINDPLMGMIVDRHTTKWGKMKPYILFAAAPIAVFTILMYLSPNLSPTALAVYSAVVYVLWGMIYTMADVPFWGLPNVLTPDPEERSHVISFSKIWNSIGSALPEVFFFIAGFALPKIVQAVNAEAAGNPEQMEKIKYLSLACIVIVIGITLYVNSYFHIKERAVPPIKKKEKGEPSQLKRLFTCKPLLLVILMGVFSSGRYMVQAAAIHVARYAFYVGPDLTGMTLAEKTAAINASVSTVKTIFQVCAIVGMFGVTILMPALMKRFDYKKLLITTCLAGFVASIGTTLIGWFTANLYACIPFVIISCIPLGVINTMSIAMIYDCLDYMELKTGHRDNALGAACQGFINKLGSALSTCGIVVMYMIIGFEPSQMLNSTTIMAATELTRTQNFAMFSLVSIVPGISLLLCSIPMFFYTISGERKKKMQSDLQAKREAEGFVVAE
ncbi:MAG: MFS transporter [Clostridia bacterium]|nr:MFS transporter [Clostridia bacterium]